jgi:transcriptional regulator with XRE-family HTH domain
LIDTDPFKYAADLKLKIERHPELSREEVAERMRISAQRISDWLALNAVIPEIRELYRTGEIDLAACERAGRLPSERQVGYAEQLIGRSLERPLDVQFSLSLWISETQGPQLAQLVELIGRPLVGSNPTWRFAEASELIRAIGYAKRLGLLSKKIQTEAPWKNRE